MRNAGAVVTITILLSSCANFSNQNQNATGGSNSTNNSAINTGGSGTNTNTSCSGNPNINPQGLSQFDSAWKFTACSVANTPNSVQLASFNGQSRTVCIYPAQITGPTSATVFFINSSAGFIVGNLVNQCLAMTSAAQTFTFSSVTSFNALYAVDPAYQLAFEACVVGGNPVACVGNLATPFTFGYGAFSN